jgi:hypothetical protein
MADYNDDEIDTISKKLSFVSSTAEDQLEAGAKAGILLIDYHPSSGSPSPPVNSDDDNLVVFSIRKVYKNLLIISVAMLFMSTSYTSISVLQSSLNTEKNIGVNSLIITYATTIVNTHYVIMKQ